MRALFTRLVRVLKVAALVSIIVGVVRSLRARKPIPATGQAQWLPIADPPVTEPREGPVTFTAVPADAAETAEEPEDPDRWLAPVEGVCPATHPVKGNAGSGIFHVPGGLSYDRTVPERCYATPEDAEADGFRQAKR